MTAANMVAIPGGFLLKDGYGNLAPFNFRDYHSAYTFARMHPQGTFTHLTKAWRIIRAIDGVQVLP